MFAIHIHTQALTLFFFFFLQVGDTPESVSSGRSRKGKSGKALSVPNYEWPCHLLIIPALKYQETPSQGDSERFPTWFNCLWSLALWMGKQHIIRHHSVLFHVASWKGCYWVFEGDLWYVRCSLPCERIRLTIWVNMCMSALMPVSPGPVFC